MQPANSLLQVALVKEFVIRKSKIKESSPQPY